MLIQRAHSAMLDERWILARALTGALAELDLDGATTDAAMLARRALTRPQDSDNACPDAWQLAHPAGSRPAGCATCSANLGRTDEEPQAGACDPPSRPPATVTLLGRKYIVPAATVDTATIATDVDASADRLLDSIIQEAASDISHAPSACALPECRQPIRFDATACLWFHVDPELDVDHEVRLL
jgi:hypothetical protein